MKNLLLVLPILISSIAFARGGGTVGNGGDSLALEFNTLLNRALAKVKVTPDPVLKDLRSIRLETQLPELKVVTVDTPLESRLDSAIQESTAINFPENQLILVNRWRWQGIKNDHLKEALALHEMLSLLGKESTGKYPYSSIYAAQYNIPASELSQSSYVSVEKAEYKKGADVYSLEARARLMPKADFFNEVRIEYVFKKNGNPLVPMQAFGGSMPSCTYGDSRDPSSLPKNFVSIAGGEKNPFGFFVHGLGICGNTTSGRSQLMVPSGSENYEVREFIHKTPPIVRANSGQPEIWYLDQVWGKCGTAGSFFVPNLLKISKYGGIERGPLPINPSDIPSFDRDYSYDLFHAYYVSGLRLYDSQLMRIGAKYFDSVGSLPEWNESCGLPTSKADAISSAGAMRLIEEQLKFFSIE